MLLSVCRAHLCRVGQHAVRNFRPTAVRHFGASTVLAQQQVQDPIQQLFLNKIREYAAKKESGEAIQMPASAEQALQEELERIEKLYGLTDEKIEMEPVIEFEDAGVVLPEADREQKLPI